MDFRSSRIHSQRRGPLFIVLIASIVITLAISLGWLIRFFSYSQMGIYFHLESFNENSTVPDEHEVDLHALQQYDDALQYSVVCSIFLCFFSFLELCAIFIRFSKKYGCRKYYYLSLDLIFLAMFITQILEIGTVWNFSSVGSEPSELNNEIHVLFSAFGSRNLAGLKEIEETFSCHGYKLVENRQKSDSENNCTEKLQNLIEQINVSTAFIIIYSVVKVIVLAAITSSYAYLCYKYWKYRESVPLAPVELGDQPDPAVEINDSDQINHEQDENLHQTVIELLLLNQSHENGNC